MFTTLQKFCLHASVGAGSYHLLTFTSGILLRKTREEPENPSKLVIGEGDNAKLTKSCRQVASFVFYSQRVWNYKKRILHILSGTWLSNTTGRLMYINTQETES